jgi:hypothetical protein
MQYIESFDRLDTTLRRDLACRVRRPSFHFGPSANFIIARFTWDLAAQPKQ